MDANEYSTGLSGAGRYLSHARGCGRAEGSSSEAAGENEVKQLLLFIDTDENGKISKQEWIKFMEAEFDRLDKDKKGQLDAKELTQSKLRVSHPVSVGK